VLLERRCYFYRDAHQKEMKYKKAASNRRTPNLECGVLAPLLFSLALPANEMKFRKSGVKSPRSKNTCLKGRVTLDCRDT
jgi:hypothetical protein